MSDNYDISLDELVQKKQSFRRGRGGSTRGSTRGRGWSQNNPTQSLSTRGFRGGRGGFVSGRGFTTGGRGRGISTKDLRSAVNTADVTVTQGMDLRDKLKTAMPDLRAAIKEKESRAKPFQSEGTRSTKASATTREGLSSRGKASSGIFQSSSKPTTGRSQPSPSSRATRSAADPKKIRITIPGLSHSRAETVPLTRREERLGQSVLQQRDQRHEAHSRSRDDYASRTLASALKNSVYPPLLRGPSPPRDVYSSARVEKSYSGVFTPEAHGISTGTVLMISNLSATVSRTDIIDLCEVCGPIESAQLLGRGVAEVVFLSKDDAQEAYRRYHKRNLDGMPMICKLLTDTRATGMAMVEPTLARYTELSAADYEHGQHWLY